MRPFGLGNLPICKYILTQTYRYADELHLLQWQLRPIGVPTLEQQSDGIRAYVDAGKTLRFLCFHVLYDRIALFFQIVFIERGLRTEPRFFVRCAQRNPVVTIHVMRLRYIFHPERYDTL